MKKIVIKVQMNCEKCKVKAMEIATTAPGVTLVSLMGEISKGKIMVTGNVDPVSLTRILRKKVGHTTFESVTEVKNENKAEEFKKVEEQPKVEYYPYAYPYNFHPPQFHPQFYWIPADTRADVYENSFCSMM